MPPRQPHRCQCLAKCPDLIELDQDRIADVLVNSPLKEGAAGREQIVADELYSADEPRSQLFPTRPIVFGEAILHARNWKVRDPAFEPIDHLAARQFLRA